MVDTPIGSDEEPLVSVVVRSMGRRELRHALAAIAAQDYPAIEVIVVDATGGQHPELPALTWRPGHALRLVSRGDRLSRPVAANVGLESVRGRWFTFLDDDDTCESDHVSTLVLAARDHPDALVVYGAGRLLDHEGRVQKAFGLPFNRALMHFVPLFYWQAALISTRARDLGCRFDPAFAVCEDRDFLAQIARHGDFVFVPSASTFNFRPDLGTSGTGRGPNRDESRLARYEKLLHARWAGTGTFHNERVLQRCRNAVRAYFAGELDKAKDILAGVLAHYADDPNALNGMARVALAEGRIDDAERYVHRAIDITPHAPEFRETLASVDACRARSFAAAAGDGGSSSRLALCSCGSGRRYKNCCGRLRRQENALSPVDPIAEQAKALLERGEAYAARDALRAATAGAGASRELLLAAGRLELELDAPTAAFPLLERALAFGRDSESGQWLDASGAALARHEREASLWTAIVDLVTRSQKSSRDSAMNVLQPLRLVVVSSDAGQLEQAVLLRDTLGGRAEIASIAPGAVATSPPSTATLVVFDTQCDWAATAAPPRRVVVRMTCDAPEALLRTLARLHDVYPEAELAFTRPGAGFGDPAAITMPVEYPWVSGASLAAPPAPTTSNRPLTIGWIGRPNALDDHPNDPALYRALMRDGHRIAVPATEFLRRAFRDDPPGLRPNFATDRGSEWPDIALFRGRPGQCGAHDDHILRAMAAARPVVAFGHGIAAREWFDGGTGFVVETEDDARRCIAQLAADPALRRDVGLAARAAVKALSTEQRARARAFYFGVSVNE